MFGLTKPSLTLRIVWGKIIGLMMGGIGFTTIPYFLPDADILLRLGVLFWYSTLGAVIGIAGVYTWHPILKFKIGWWWRGMLFGSWFNFVLMLFIYDKIEKMLDVIISTDSALHSPWLIVVEGALFGLIIDWLLTKIAGEGRATVETTQSID